MTAGFLRRRPALDLDIHYIHRTILSGRTSLALINWRPSPAAGTVGATANTALIPVDGALALWLVPITKTLARSVQLWRRHRTAERCTYARAAAQRKASASAGPLLCSA